MKLPGQWVNGRMPTVTHDGDVMKIHSFWVLLVNTDHKWVPRKYVYRYRKHRVAKTGNCVKSGYKGSIFVVGAVVGNEWLIGKYDECADNAYFAKGDEEIIIEKDFYVLVIDS